MTFGAILFDLDHTLFDSDTSSAAAWAMAAAAAGIERPDDHRAEFERINAALWRSVERGEITPNDVRERRFTELLVSLGRTDDAPSLVAPMADAFLEGLIGHGELYPGAEDLLDAVADRPVGLVTNGIGKVQRGRLERLSLAARFDAISISGELGTAKPARAIFDHALSALADPDRSTVAMVGDNWSSDIVGAQNAGVAPIWFNPRADEPPADARGVDSVHTVRTLGEVQQLLTG